MVSVSDTFSLEHLPTAEAAVAAVLVILGTKSVRLRFMGLLKKHLGLRSESAEGKVIDTLSAMGSFIAGRKLGIDTSPSHDSKMVAECVITATGGFLYGWTEWSHAVLLASLVVG